MPQKGIMTLQRRVFFSSASSVGGAEEEKGPLGKYLDVTDVKEDDKFGTSSWEAAEGEMQKRALTTAIAKAGITEHDIDAVFAGDLQNQCVGSNYGLLDFDMPYFGLYGACSTCAEALILGAAYCAGMETGPIAAVASSHNCVAERQFRFPIEYGGQRSPTSQWTVTGAGAFVLSAEGEPEIPAIVDFLPGRSIDRGINDLNNMGAAMAPAAIDTLKRYFDQSGRTPDSFDMILTGDLGTEGSRILREFMAASGYDISGVHEDCGLLIYDTEGTDKHAGGSGCGCSATVLSSFILPRMGVREEHKSVPGKPLYDILFMATGALMSPASVYQGNNIPGICHLVHIQRERGQ